MTGRPLKAALHAVRRACGSALWFLLVVLAGGVRFIVTLPERLILGTMEFWTDVMEATTGLGRLVGLTALLGLATLPGWAGGPLVSVMITALWFAYAGQAWNILTGFTGLVSLGHSLFIGLGAYLGAGLMVSVGLPTGTAAVGSAGIGLGVGIGLGLVVGVLAAAALGTGIGALGFRRGLSGAHFALLTLVFAEFGRVVFDYLDASGRLMVAPRATTSPTMFYYLILLATVWALILSRCLMRSRLGYRCFAVREDPEAAAAAGVDVGRTKLALVALSAALSAPAGMFQAFYVGSLAPDQVFSLTRSLEILLGPMVGGLGTAIGPVLGALVVAPLGEVLNHRGPVGLEPLCAGLLLIVVVVFRPTGLWPWLALRLRLVPDAEPEDGAARQ